MKRLLLSLLASFCCALSVQAAEVNVAVAANFSAPMQKIAQAFEQDTGHSAILAFASTGKFYAQITHGAPFQLLLSADAETPLRLEKDGLGVTGSRFTYAIGKLALWSAQADLIKGQEAILRRDQFSRLAIADPKLAPYGAAALETLDKLGLTQALQAKFVKGENIAQTYQFVATGNAQLGFVALSQVYIDGHLRQGSAWIVPENLHKPIRQDAILLSAGKDNSAARALLNYLKGEKARQIIQSYGYGL